MNLAQMFRASECHYDPFDFGKKLVEIGSTHEAFSSNTDDWLCVGKPCV